MIADLSKATTLYFTPLLMLASLFLILFAYLAPAVMLHSQVALLTVTPSSALTQPGSNQAVDGPSMLVGVLGSCSKSNNAAGLTCTTPSISPLYNTSVFTPNTPSSVLAAPPTAAPAFLAVALAFTFIFFVMYTAISFRHLMGKAGNVWEKPMVQRASAWIGIFAFLVGLASFLIIRMYFGKAADDFNQSIQGQGTNGPQLIANTSNAFTMIWVGYAFFAVPVVVSLAKLHVLATK
ncbi:hypothetical protein HYDPIDRAFT_106606 [Hydnomerulius pinastri MD-312]|nr:hypothetical protein HYDPIDRAFT_106606 [Hydnomerulius pinastri MD-312]